ncbi:MAG: D-aminoacylase [Candidatus Abyssobacteria bacterium SURF_17]|uniref:D-aminoacylase n=1 Tax=Candidatus Abyssobacteria bacterium SURF_17 TaxID=2093361 RepID=A0A419F4D4_9BACT|nr:MAG: D-aminoacylase [Candidatus Abyssubacteria bacterium SURF_17]
MPLDLIIRNGNLIDGSGKLARKADVAVDGDRIAEIGNLANAQAKRVIDADGLAVAPGFIDIHSHFDWPVIDPDHSDLLSPLLKQGVTTMVTGNCGFSPAPLSKEFGEVAMRRAMVQMLGESSFRGRSFEEMFPWKSMGEFLDHLARRGVSFNIAQLAGHGTIHVAVKGEDSSPPNRDELEKMKTLARASLEQGAFGISTGLGYSPGIFSPQEEIAEFARLTKEYGAMFPSHLQAYSWVSPAYEEIGGEPHNLRSVKDFIRVGEVTGQPLQISHLIFVGEKTWQETTDAVLAEIEAAVRRGVNVGFDAYAYTVGISTIAVVFPAWALPNLVKNLQDPDTRERIRGDLDMARGLLQFGYDDLILMWGASPRLSQYEGMTIREIAETRGEDPFDAYCYLVVESKALARIFLAQYSGNERDESVLRRVLAHPLNSFETDCMITRQGWQYPNSWGNYPRILGHYVRELKLMSLEEAVRKMTSLPASRTGLKDRGLLKKGYAADVVVFNPDTVLDRATLKRPTEESVGIEHVLLNGHVVVDKGKYDSGQLHGKVLRR